MCAFVVQVKIVAESRLGLSWYVVLFHNRQTALSDSAVHSKGSLSLSRSEKAEDPAQGMRPSRTVVQLITDFHRPLFPEKCIDQDGQLGPDRGGTGSAQPFQIAFQNTVQITSTRSRQDCSAAGLGGARHTETSRAARPARRSDRTHHPATSRNGERFILRSLSGRAGSLRNR